MPRTAGRDSGCHHDGLKRDVMLASDREEGWWRVDPLSAWQVGLALMQRQAGLTYMRMGMYFHLSHIPKLFRSLGHVQIADGSGPPNVACRLFKTSSPE